jgi:hypothetical protein
VFGGVEHDFTYTADGDVVDMTCREKVAPYWP